MTVLSAIMLMFVGILDQTQRSWDLAQGRVSQFREARVAFDIITKNLSQATLNTYVEQVDSSPGDGKDIPDAYEVKSELNFRIMYGEDIKSVQGDKPGHAIFFQAPLGVTHRASLDRLSNLMNARGYYIVHNSDRPYRPGFVNTPERFRYRLMEYLPPSEQNRIYIDYAESLDNPRGEYFDNWWEHNLQKYSRPLAENIVAITFVPRRAIAEIDDGQGRDEAILSRNYKYDSQYPEGDETQDAKTSLLKHQLPPLIKVSLIAIDETSAMRLEDRFGKKPFLKNVGLSSNWMKSAENEEEDIKEVIDKLDKTTVTKSKDGALIRYKIFSTTVGIQGAKWMTAIDEKP